MAYIVLRIAMVNIASRVSQLSPFGSSIFNGMAVEYDLVPACSNWAWPPDAEAKPPTRKLLKPTFYNPLPPSARTKLQERRAMNHPPYACPQSGSA